MRAVGERFRMAVIYEQESWEGGIVDKRDLKQGRGGSASKISYGGSRPGWEEAVQRAGLVVHGKETERGNAGMEEMGLHDQWPSYLGPTQQT